MIAKRSRRSLLVTMAAALGWIAAARALPPAKSERRVARLCAAPPRTDRDGPAVRVGPPELLALAASEPIVALARGEGELLAVTRSDLLLRRVGTNWRTLADGFDPHAPLAAGHGRIVGRSSAGWLRVVESGQLTTTVGPRIAPHGGFVNLAEGIIAVTAPHAPGVAQGPRRGRPRVEQSTLAPRLVRFERDGNMWREATRSVFAVLPDARPLQVELDCPETGDVPRGQIAVLAAPDELRYRHGVLGDATEATQIIYAHRHSLAPLATLELAPPHVFEDIVLRRVADLDTGQELLVTMRSGPQGAALVLVGRADPGAAELVIVAQGPPLGTRNRWMAPIVADDQLFAIHTPHIGGVLTGYRRLGARLLAQPLRDGVSNHTAGSRDLNVSATIGKLLVVPTQSRDALVGLDLNQDARVLWRLPLEAPVSALLAIGEQIFVLDTRGRVYAATVR